ncbi:hypothetical protein Z042_14800 [Chania multitudinisentens RB-25]|uniref:Uncharacterized protein n=1 Tax=Chania multitudinisentens RB-25 TaxID=1441930 RepID=W0LEC7_9GAMM|nr:hypothetical protein [Chania multitudinisentens]AHG20734.2 hypothetical protein Z042_14800 [Chania multitudinisentens RB-25]
MLNEPKIITLSLSVAAALTAVAAALHFSCIFIGAPAFRFLGAGEVIAKMAERGHWYPSFIAFVIGIVLTSWAAYALSGAGVTPRLPLTPYALFAIALIFLFRAVGFPLLKSAFPENSQTFWFVTSGICLVIGLAFLIGAIGLWRDS